MTKNNNRYHKNNRLLNGVIGLAVLIVFVCAIGQGNLRKDSGITAEGNSSRAE